MKGQGEAFMIKPARRRIGHRFGRGIGRRTAIVAVCMLPGVVFGQAKPEALVLRCSGRPHVSDTRAGFYFELLDLVMKKTGVAYRIEPRPEILTGQQVLERFPEQQVLVLAWGTDSSAWQEKFWPVAAPRDKGILGWRLLLIGNRDRARFPVIRSHAELA
jgi:hypothetical protein